MNNRLKVTFWLLMTAALACGFLHHVVPPEEINFERLHIFLFNLCSGGTLLIYFTEKKSDLSIRGRIFLLLALCFAVCAFLKWYHITLIIPLMLSVITEQVRVRHFGDCWPKALFTAKEPTARKFHQASLLCLSLGLMISSLAILNSEFTHWVNLEKFKLDTFFLGFSFPISLISMSVIFSLMQRRSDAPSQPLLALGKELSFWVINLGVIIFFVFILAGWFLPQVAIASTLFAAVSLVLYLYVREGIRLQQKAFLTSGILFLVITSVTGILYILFSFSPDYTVASGMPLRRMHAFTALYGWNLSGLVVISRHGEFPIRLHSRQVLALHWVTVLFLCPLGYFFPLAAVAAVISYGILLFVLLFKHGQSDRSVAELQGEMLAGRE